MEEERPLMPRTGISGDNERIQRRVSLRGALGVFFCALVLFILSYLASRSIFYSSSDTVAVDLAYSGTGLIWPLNGSHPTLTSTSECTTSELPVLAGADVVEYFTMTEGSKPVMADGKIRSMHGGYLFFFNSVDNRRAFEADPQKFIPAWGGFCSYGVAAEAVWTAKNLGPFGNPSKWRILSDGRLHLFRSEVPMNKFLRQPETYVAKGDSKWSSWFDEAPDSMTDALQDPLNTGDCISPLLSCLKCIKHPTMLLVAKLGR